MDTCKINFCNTSGFLISNKRDRSNILKRLEKYTNIKEIYEKSYNDNLINVMKKKTMLSCFITRGKKYYLYLTKINNENVALLIDQTNQNAIPRLISIPISLKKHVYNDTLFTGEMLLFDHNWTFLIENCKLYNGKSTHHMSVIEVVKLCNDFVNNDYIDNQLCPFDILAKKFFTIDNIDYNLKNNKIPLIGIRFYGLKNPIVFYFNIQNYNNSSIEYSLMENYGNHHIKTKIKQIQDEYENMFNQKESNLETNLIDSKTFEKQFTLKIKKSPNYGIYDAYAFDYKSKTLKKIGVSRVITIETNKTLIEHFLKNKDMIALCRYNPDFCKWEIIDKSSCDIAITTDVYSHIECFKKYQKSVFTD